MRMSTKITVIAAIVLVIGLGGGYFIGNNGQKSAPVEHNMGSTMDGMTAGLEGKENAEFEKAFLAEMIVHHEGAVAMAHMVLEKSNRPELTKLANDIIAAQTAEIAQMREWQKTWFAVENSAVHPAQ